MFRPSATRCISLCTDATSPETKRISGPSTRGSSRLLKTHVGMADSHLVGSLRKPVWSSLPSSVLRDPLVRRRAPCHRAALGDEPRILILHAARLAELEEPAQRVVRVGNEA